MTKDVKNTGYHAIRWNEPVIMEMSKPGRRGTLFPQISEILLSQQGYLSDLIPEGMQRTSPLELPELSEPDVLRHYLHLSQETLGMMGINLFGTCTMKYNSRLNELLVCRPEIAETHPLQDQSTIQGTLQIIYELNEMLCQLSGMSQFTFQPAGGADAAYTHNCVTRAWLASKGELGKRDEIITTIQSHPCNPATAATAGFKVITLPLGPDGYPTLEALKAAVSDRTAALLLNNPDDMGIYNPNIKQWIEIVHEAGGLCFYDHANFNGVMGRIRARELGFDACMFMLHKTFGAPKGGGGPALGAYGCSEELAQFLPKPLVTFDGEYYHLNHEAPNAIEKVREFLGNIPIVIKAYAWILAMGRDGIKQAADLSVLGNNYMEKRLMALRGVTRSHEDLDVRRLEMTRFSVQKLFEETGVTTFDIQARMTDFGIDAYWLSHEPWLVPQPFTPESGEMWSKEDLDRWIDVLEIIIDEAYSQPDIVKTAPHCQVVHRVNEAEMEDPEKWAITWRAYKRKILKQAI